ncbi:MAG TPA: glycosyl hydrolase family 8 [Candidatus Paceibacterota bacterium]|nr:glycosyl hydrolase family 8 [Candidatus Paceibacterota bacterium]
MENSNRLSILVWGTVIVVVLLCLVFALNIGNILNVEPAEFSKSNMLQALWYQYKNNYLEPNTLRALDKQRSNITTSEGQSYTMLRSVWMDDKATFDGVWQWTKDNLQRKEDHLMSWLFGERSNGSYGVLTSQGGYNTASDADEDIALSLVFAWKRWNDQKYFGDAILVIRDIWDKEVITIGGKPYLVADNVEKTASKSTAIVNPSYLSPYAYKIFAQVDPSHDWLGLAATSYSVIDQSMRLGLDKESTAFLPPDWISINKTTGEISAPQGPSTASLTTNFGFDAIRVPWRLALDYQWTGDPRPKTILGKMEFLQNQWRKNHALFTSYTHDGRNASDADAPATYGGTIGYFMTSDEGDAAALYRDKLEALYDPNESRWLKPESYYDENWAWFGMALYDGELQDLYKGGPKTS